VCLIGALLPHSSFAQPPQPIDGVRFAFPGGAESPASAVSAALALSDRWLGHDPFANPAIPAARHLEVSPIAFRVSREDLHAENRDFSDEGGYFDFAGAWGSWPLGRLALTAYVSQPELRLEDNAYSVGRLPQPGLAATVTNHSSVRELRTGAGASAALGRVRVGAALEWNRRSEEYRSDQESGSPSSGTSDVTYDGSAIGAQFGARGDWPMGAQKLEVGAAMRYVPSLDLDGTQTFDLISGSGQAPVHTTRGSAWEGGVTMRIPTAETFHVIAGVGGRGAQAWEGFDVKNGERFEWKLGGEFHDARDPWTLRFGGGEEQQTDVSEARIGVFSLGLGWQFKNTSASFGLMHRTLGRTDEPNSYEDRIVATVSLP